MTIQTLIQKQTADPVVLGIELWPALKWLYANNCDYASILIE